MTKRKDQVSAVDKEAFLDVIEELDPQGKNLLALMIFAIARRDPNFCDALDALRKTSSESSRGSKPRYEAEGDLLSRIGRVCPEDERSWWEQSLSVAKHEGDGVMYQGLIDLMQRRAAS